MGISASVHQCISSSAHVSNAQPHLNCVPGAKVRDRALARRLCLLLPLQGLLPRGMGGGGGYRAGQRRLVRLVRLIGSTGVGGSSKPAQLAPALAPRGREKARPGGVHTHFASTWPLPSTRQPHCQLRGSPPPPTSSRCPMRLGSTFRLASSRVGVQGGSSGRWVAGAAAAAAGVCTGPVCCAKLRRLRRLLIGRASIAALHPGCWKHAWLPSSTAPLALPSALQNCRSA